ncbi:hypothetical protein NUW54_g12126 [Trametes sanguinea]|uniref:Uncharacterized protein n=1 Tax=Trametes sanguinea TaxID=158606 RepID=A0ACC1N3P4_9APHY|nr:hypothetical protein NUW54_g12126 [Trametes sanguinea]
MVLLPCTRKRPGTSSRSAAGGGNRANSLSETAVALGRVWKVYKNTPDGGITKTMRTHLKKQHRATYEAVCTILASQGKLKRTAPLSAGDADNPSSRRIDRNLPFTQDNLMYFLARWIVADDQSINVVECPEFQDLMFFLRPDLDEGDLPGRTRMTEFILKQWAETKRAILDDLKASPGRVHYTCDIWSDQELATYLAVTAHHSRTDEKGYTLSTCNHLLAFRRIHSHAGAVVADAIVKFLREADILSKTGMFTLDNASTNDTLMENLECLLRDAGIPFDREGNRIRCFPHVINIAVQHILHELKAEPLAPLDASDVPYEQRSRAADALSGDPLGKVRSLVSFCRQSNQRRVEFQRTIQEGNLSGLWKDADGKVITLPLLQLLRDCETRWSSTYLMLQRIFLLYPAIHTFLRHASRADISHVALTDAELDVLKQIYQVLEVAHDAQQLVSSERTPSLSIALPAYELVLVAWKQLRLDLPHLRHYIDRGIEKIQEYVYKSRKSRIYALAIALNPAFKLEWIRQHWSAEAAAQAESWILDTVCVFHQGFGLCN